MNVSLLKKLKKKLVESEEFKDVWDFFYNHFVGQEATFRGSQHVDDPVLLAAMQTAVKQMFGRNVTLQQMNLFGFPHYNFVHGGFFVEGCPGMVLYFDDIQKGLIMVSLVPPKMETKYCRITAVMQTDPMNN